MTTKIHLRRTVQGAAVCATRRGIKPGGKVAKNSRMTYKTIPASRVVDPAEFRATPAADRCAHCSERFTETLNARRALSGKPLYLDAFTQTLA